VRSETTRQRATTDETLPPARRIRGKRRLEHHLARVFGRADGPLERAEIVVSLARAVAVLTATQSHTHRHATDAQAEQTEVELVLTAAIAHLQATQRREHRRDEA
jgi:hypothetical protein